MGHRLLNNPGHNDFFGRTKRGKMAEGIADYFPNISTKLEDEAKLDADKKKELQKEREDLRALAVWLAHHPRPEKKDEAVVQGGHQAIRGPRMLELPQV